MATESGQMAELEEGPVDSTISQEELDMALQDLVDSGQETANGILLLKQCGQSGAGQGQARGRSGTG